MSDRGGKLVQWGDKTLRLSEQAKDTVNLRRLLLYAEQHKTTMFNLLAHHSKVVAAGYASSTIKEGTHRFELSSSVPHPRRLYVSVGDIVVPFTFDCAQVVITADLHFFVIQAQSNLSETVTWPLLSFVLFDNKIADYLDEFTNQEVRPGLLFEIDPTEAMTLLVNEEML